MSNLEPRTRRTPQGSAWEDHAGLVEALRAGNPAALQEVMDTYWKPLLHFARQNLSGVAEPEDIVQDAFLRLWAQRKDLRPEGSIKALLYATVRSLSLDEYRRWKSRSRWDFGLWTQTSVPSPMDELLGSELRRLADDAIHSLPPRRRAIFKMVRKRGLSYRETADTLGVSPQTVANSMSSALADLRERLAPLLSDSGELKGAEKAERK